MFYLRCLVALCCVHLFAADVLRAEVGQNLRTQTIQLTRGWNAVFLEVYPAETKPSALFANTPGIEAEMKTLMIHAETGVPSRATLIERFPPAATAAARNADRGDDRRLECHEQQQEPEHQHDADHDRRVGAESGREIGLLGRRAADHHAPRHLGPQAVDRLGRLGDRKSTRLNSSHRT